MTSRVLLSLAVFAALAAAAPASHVAGAAGQAASPKAPAARFAYAPARPTVGRAITFTASRTACRRCSFRWQDDGPDGARGRQWPLGKGRVLRYRFKSAGRKRVRLIATDRRGRRRSVRRIVVVRRAASGPAPLTSAPPAAPAPSPAPDAASPSARPAQPSCQPDAVPAASADAVRSVVASGRNACVTSAVGDVDLDGLTAQAVRHVGTSGAGAMGFVSLARSSRITVRARFRSTTIRGSSLITIEQSIIGGTPSNRTYDQLVFLPDTNDDVVIADNDIGWTLADDSGNTGFGIRAYGTNNRLRVLRNRIHDLASDGIQGVGGVDVLIDRNEIGPVGANPGSSQHSDNIQITGNDEGLRITNNWIRQQGYFAGAVANNAGATYIHGGSNGSLLYENNLVQVARGRVEFGGLGTGGTSRSNLTVRRNTFYDLGQEFRSFEGMEWDISSGSNNLLERNAAWDPDGGATFSGSAVTSRDNVFSSSKARVEIGADGDCVTAACNPAGQEPIGYRKPSGVRW